MTPPKPAFNAAASAPLSKEAVDSFTYTAGHGSKVALLKAIVEHGPDIVAALDSKGRTALTSAAEFGHKEVMDLLIEHGARVNQPDANGRTPLMIAAHKNHPVTVGFLLDRGADINAQDKDGRTALHIAATHRTERYARTMSRRKVAVIDLLVERDAAMDITDSLGCTVVKWLERQGYSHMASRLSVVAEERKRLRESDIAVFKDGVAGDVTVLRLRYKRNAP